METWQLIFLAILGVVAGVLNVVAGGGSLLTLPAMLFLGMDAPVANGTNRVAIFAQNISAIAAFRRKGYSEFFLSLTLALATIPGAIGGALLGCVVRGVVFNRILAVIMIAILFQMMWKRKAPAKPSGEVVTPDGLNRRQRLLGHLCMVGVGFYGGFIQAGVGFILMASLHNVMGIGLIRVNMHKVFIVGVFTLASLIVFAIRGHVLWMPGLALAAGNSLGGWIGSQMSVLKGEAWIRRVLYGTLVLMALKLFWPG